jgi:hypothetical protein
MHMLLATGLLERVWNDPFDYAWKAVLVVLAIGFVINAVKNQFDN